MTKKIAVVIHLVQPYRCGLYRALAAIPGIDLTVYFTDSWGVDGTKDDSMNEAIKWDTPVLEGFKHHFVKNRSLLRNKPIGADRCQGVEGKPFSTLRYYGALILGHLSPGIFFPIFRGRYDYIILDGYFPMPYLYALWAAKARGTKVLLRAEAYHRPGRNRLLLLLKALYVRLFIKTSHAVLFSCRTNRDYFLSYGAVTGRMQFFPSSVDNEFFRAEAAKCKDGVGEERRRLGIPEDAIVVLGVGRFTERKRFFDLVRACELAAQENNRVFLVLVGNGPEAPEMKRYVQSKDLRNVIFAGFQNQSKISRYYALSDLIALPSSYDPSPKALNEALNFALPAVVSRSVGTADELCVHGRNGFVYETGDVTQLARCLVQLANDADLRRRFGEESLRIADAWSFSSCATALQRCISA